MSTTGWWILGYAVGGAVVIVAASLLIAINLLARRVVTQTAEIARALDEAMRNTNSLFDIGMLNHSIEAVTRGLRQVAGVSGPQDERNLRQRLSSLLRRR